MAASDADRLALLAWLGLLASAGVGFAVRCRRAKRRDWLGAVWLSLCLIVALCAPPVWAEVAGGCLAGTLIALLVPRRFLIRPAPHVSTAEPVSAGSTQTLRPAAVGVLLLVGLCAAVGNAQDGGGPTQADGEETRTVLIPVDADGTPAESLPVVYVERELLARLEHPRPEEPSPQYLIASAEYEGTIDAARAAEITAAWTVHLLPGEGNVVLRLPLTDANLGGPDACTVDGVPHSIERSPDGTGYTVRISRAAAKQSEGSAPSIGGSVETVRILLKMHPATATVAGGGALSMTVPRVADSRLTLDFAEPFTTIEASGRRGELRIDADGREVHVDLGPSATWQIDWSTNSAPSRPRGELEARFIGLVEARPTHLQIRCRVSYRLLRGWVDDLAWHLPAEMIVRKITGSVPVSATTLPADEGASKLLLEFAAPQTSEFFIDATLLLPIDAKQERFTIPPLDFHAGADAATPVTLASHRLGIAAPSEFELTALQVPAEQALPISIDAFWQDAAAFAARRPQWAYRLQSPVEMSFALAVRRPRQRIEAEQT
ncbi:MAG: hypothetical protein ACREIV_05330, partial [Planctomycetaceae bacterium]